MNEQEHADHAGRTPTEALQVMREMHEALIRLVDAHQDDDLTWLVPELADLNIEHADELRAWRTR